MSGITTDEDGKVVQREGGTVTRMVGIALPNNKVVMAPVEVWITALLNLLTPKEMQQVAAQAEVLTAGLSITPLSDGMVVVDKPIVGLHV